MGMVIPSEDELRERINRTGLAAQGAGYFLRTLRPSEEWSLFLALRVESLICAARYEETLYWSARALQLAPGDPLLPGLAHYGLDLAMKHRIWRYCPREKISSTEHSKASLFNAEEFLRLEERSWYLTIVAHGKEAQGQLVEARHLYEEACRRNAFGNSEQRDLQRFLLKYGLRNGERCVMPPKCFYQLRRLKLECMPQEEAVLLRSAADQYERAGDLIKARDAMHDLYILNPSDGDVFERARDLETRLRGSHCGRN
jgi:hypothetical protein